MTLSPYAQAVEDGLANLGLEAVSTGVCPGCETCREDWGYNSLAELDTAYANDEVVDEGYFSWRSCDCCGSSLGGDREPAHGIDEARNLIHFSMCVDCALYLANSDEPKGETE